MTNILELLKHEKVEWKKLGEVCEFVNGFAFKSKLFSEQGEPVIRITNISAGTVIYEDLKYTDLRDCPNLDKYKVEKNDILVAMSGATTGKIGYQYEERKGYINQRVGKFIPNESKVNRRYLFHFLFSAEKQLFSLASGNGAQPNLSSEAIKKMEIPIPSLEIQQKIVKILDNFMNYVTELQSELQSRTKQYTYYRDMLLSEDYLNKVTKKMEEDRILKIVQLDEVIKIKNGKDWKELKEGDIPVYGSGGEMGVYVSKYAYDKPTVLIPRKGSIKNVFYMESPFWNVDTIFYTEIDESKLIPKYFYYFIEYFDLSKLSENSTRPSLTQSTLNGLKFPLPSLSLQNKIVRILDKFQVMLADTEGLLPEEIKQRQKQYEYYREKLLTFETDCDSTHARTLILSNHYYELLEKVSRLVGITFEDKVRVEEKTLGEIVTIVLGGTPNKNVREFWDNGSIPWMSSGEVNKRNIYITDNYITEKGYRNSSATLVPKNSTVIALAGQGKTRGMVARIKIELSTNQSLATLVPKEKIINDYLFYFLNAQYLKLRSISSGDGSRGGLNKEILSKFLVLLPPLHVQQHIVSILDKFDTLVHDIKEGLPKEIQQRQKQYEYWREQLLSFNR